MRRPTARGGRRQAWQVEWPITPAELAELTVIVRRLQAHTAELRRVGAYQHPRPYGRELHRLVKSLQRQWGPERVDRYHAAGRFVVRGEAEGAILAEALHGPDRRAED